MAVVKQGEEYTLRRVFLKNVKPVTQWYMGLITVPDPFPTSTAAYGGIYGGFFGSATANPFNNETTLDNITKYESISDYPNYVIERQKVNFNLVNYVIGNGMKYANAPETSFSSIAALAVTRAKSVQGQIDFKVTGFTLSASSIFTVDTSGGYTKTAKNTNSSVATPVIFINGGAAYTGTEHVWGLYGGPTSSYISYEGLGGAAYISDSVINMINPSQPGNGKITGDKFYHSVTLPQGSTTDRWNSSSAVYDMQVFTSPLLKYYYEDVNNPGTADTTRVYWHGEVESNTVTFFNIQMNCFVRGLFITNSPSGVTAPSTETGDSAFLYSYAILNTPKKVKKGDTIQLYYNLPVSGYEDSTAGAMGFEVISDMTVVNKS